jgi:gas vesicle protein
MADDKKKSALDKVIMGAIIGTAIGSAVGISMAPKKGSEMREAAKEKSSGFFKSAKNLLRRFLGSSKKMDAEGMKELPNEMEVIPPSTSVPIKGKDHE